MKNYYHILGVPQTASDEEIRQAYRNLAKEFHPDKNGGHDTRFVALNEAYSVLRDEHKRAAYDLDLTEATMKRRAQRASSTATTTADFGGPDPASEAGQWEDEADRPVRQQAWNRQPYRVPRDPIWDRIRRNKYLSWVVVALVLWAAFVVVTHFTNLIPSGGQPSFTPLATPSTQASGVPIVNPGSQTPTPSATPSCPTGAPTIAVNPTMQSAGGGGTGFSVFGQPQKQTYTITGTVTNHATTAITINSVGFYLGSYDSTRAPDWTDSWANMTSGGSTTVQPGQTVSWSEQQSLSSNTQNAPTAVLTYPDTDGATPTAQWSYVGSGASCSQSSSQ